MTTTTAPMPGRASVDALTADGGIIRIRPVRPPTDRANCALQPGRHRQPADAVLRTPGDDDRARGPTGCAGRRRRDTRRRRRAGRHGRRRRVVRAHERRRPTGRVRGVRRRRRTAGAASARCCWSTSPRTPARRASTSWSARCCRGNAGCCGWRRDLSGRLVPASTTASSTSACAPRPTRRRWPAGRRPGPRGRAGLAAAAAGARVGGRRRRRPRNPAASATRRCRRCASTASPAGLYAVNPQRRRGRAACPRTRSLRAPARTGRPGGHRRAGGGRRRRARRRGGAGVRAAVVLGAGFGEAGARGPARPGRAGPAGPRARDPAGRAELPRRPQHRSRGPAERHLRPGRCRPPAGWRSRRSPARSASRSSTTPPAPVAACPPSSRWATRPTSAATTCIAYWFDDPATTRGRPLPGVVRQPPQVRPDRPGAGPPQAGARRQERPVRRPASGPAPRTPPRRPRPGRRGRRPVRPGRRDAGRQPRRAARRRPDAHRPAAARGRPARPSSATPAGSTCSPPTPPRPAGLRCRS